MSVVSVGRLHETGVHETGLHETGVHLAEHPESLRRHVGEGRYLAAAAA